MSTPFTRGVCLLEVINVEFQWRNHRDRNLMSARKGGVRKQRLNCTKSTLSPLFCSVTSDCTYLNDLVVTLNVLSY